MYPKVRQVHMSAVPKAGERVLGAEGQGGDIAGTAGLAGVSGSQVMKNSAASASPPPCGWAGQRAGTEGWGRSAQGVVSLCCNGQLHAAPAHPEPASNTGNRKAPFGAGE